MKHIFNFSFIFRTFLLGLIEFKMQKINLKFMIKKLRPKIFPKFETVSQKFPKNYAK